MEEASIREAQVWRTADQTCGPAALDLRGLAVDTAWFEAAADLYTNYQYRDFALTKSRRKPSPVNSSAMTSRASYPSTRGLSSLRTYGGSLPRVNRKRSYMYINKYEAVDGDEHYPRQQALNEKER